jgi:hypothetical protein
VVVAVVGQPGMGMQVRPAKPHAHTYCIVLVVCGGTRKHSSTVQRGNLAHLRQLTGDPCFHGVVTQFLFRAGL